MTRPRADTTLAGDPVKLLAVILAGVPHLPGAACRDHVAVFDAAADGDRQAAQEAIKVCQSCPVREQCAQWAASAYPHRRPGGVIAGHYTPTNRPRKDNTA
ncbi:WhiB family transcriptional regulator [Mycobacterium sp. M1]|uniref:WhiB family transcriptional regulator n=1 Tax=Mycolicibacter acidiphilus TaxID=2835306 RepID=A0ABS5RGW7_9MYCO|nr:WhiB family transcriptional regulator [Mycolicibacter acidiphilus]